MFFFFFISTGDTNPLKIFCVKFLEKKFEQGGPPSSPNLGKVGGRPSSPNLVPKFTKCWWFFATVVLLLLLLFSLLLMVVGEDIIPLGVKKKKNKVMKKIQRLFKSPKLKYRPVFTRLSKTKKTGNLI